MLLDSKDIKADEKGKAVHVLHTWKDTLWQSGSKAGPPSEVKSMTDLLEEHAKTSDAVRTTEPTNEDERGKITSGIAMQKLSMDEISEPRRSTETTVAQQIITPDGSSTNPSASANFSLGGCLTVS
jgi:translation initiation factor 2D